MNEVSEKIIVTPKEAMKILSVGRNTMYEVLLKDKNFPSFKIGKKFFINKEKLQEWVDKQCR